MVGYQIVPLPTDWEEFDPALASAYVERIQAGAIIVYSGWIPPDDHYAVLADAVTERGARMLNSPEDHRTLLELPRWYPLIEELTARTIVVHDVEDVARAEAELTWPVFTKGHIKSVKERGFDACLITSPDELERRREAWGGSLIARELLPLRRSGEMIAAFPTAREYRFYVLQGNVLGGRYYWSDVDPFGPLTPSEETAAEEIASKAARRLPAAFAAIDVGQLEDGTWRVVEVGDPQTSTYAHMPRELLFRALLERL
jgi:hypothetical protein